MLKAGPLWAIYTASYFIDYIVVLGILVCKKISAFGLKNLIKHMGRRDWVVLLILLVLIIFSLLVMRSINRIKMTSRIKVEPKDDFVWKVYTGFLAPAIALIGTLIGDYGVLLAFVFFVVTGVVFVKSKQIHYASVFIFPMGYKIYKGDGGIIIVKDTRDGLRLRMMNDGIQAKELENGIYLVR